MSINQVSASGESIIYVRSGGEFRSFNSSVTFVSGLGRKRRITHIGNLRALPSCHLIHRKVSQSKFSELFMTSVARCNSPSYERVTTYTFILSLLQQSIHLQHMRPFSSKTKLHRDINSNTKAHELADYFLQNAKYTRIVALFP